MCLDTNLCLYMLVELQLFKIPIYRFMFNLNTDIVKYCILYILIGLIVHFDLFNLLSKIYKHLSDHLQLHTQSLNSYMLFIIVVYWSSQLIVKSNIWRSKRQNTSHVKYQILYHISVLRIVRGIHSRQYDSGRQFDGETLWSISWYLNISALWKNK